MSFSNECPVKWANFSRSHFLEAQQNKDILSLVEITFSDSRGESGLSVIDMPDRAHVQMRLVALKSHIRSDFSKIPFLPWRRPFLRGRPECGTAAARGRRPAGWARPLKSPQLTNCIIWIRKVRDSSETNLTHCCKWQSICRKSAEFAFSSSTPKPIWKWKLDKLRSRN